MIGINRYRIDKIRSDKNKKSNLDERVKRAYAAGAKTRLYTDKEGNRCVSIRWETGFFAIPHNPYSEPLERLQYKIQN